ncbi:hypothetical protein V6Z11_D02G168800 [Gossypium hirsutum]
MRRSLLPSLPFQTHRALMATKRRGSPTTPRRYVETAWGLLRRGACTALEVAANCYLGLG